MNQQEAVKQHLEKYGSITSYEAFKNYGITRLSAKIFNLRKQGMAIINENVTSVNRYEHKVTYCKYVLVKGAENGR